MNVLFIPVDDLKPAIAAFGDERAITPNLDRLAERGTIFTNAHCQQAVCAPSRVSMLTGLYADTTKVWDLRTKFRDHLPDVVTLPQTFKNNGYMSVGIGKVFDPRSTDRGLDTRSWSEPYAQVQSPAQSTFGFREPNVIRQVEIAKTSPDWPDGWKQQLRFAFPDGQPVTDAADVPDEAYEDGLVADVAGARLREFAASDEPFFFAVGFKKPHLPFNAPLKYWQLYDRDEFELATSRHAPEGAPEYASQPGWELRNGIYDVGGIGFEGDLPDDLQRELIHGYYAATSFIDAQVGELLDTLDQTGLAETTIIVLWGDHGFHLGDHGMWCKHTNYEQATRSPLIIVDPRHEGGIVNASPVELVDVFPTLVELADVEHEGTLHGDSLVPILTGEADAVSDFALSQFPRGGRDGEDKMGYAYRTDRYRLVRWRAQNSRELGEIDGPVVAVELYDYEADPLETRNLADDPAYADIRRDLEAMADAYRQEAGYRE